MGNLKGKAFPLRSYKETIKAIDRQDEFVVRFIAPGHNKYSIEEYLNEHGFTVVGVNKIR